MEIIEVVLYFILTIILIALIGVLTWLVYDYFKYKKELNEKTTNIINYSDNNDSTIKRDLTSEMNKLHSQNSNYILSTSNILFNYSSNYGVANNDYIYSTSNKLLDILNSNYEKNYRYTHNTSNQIYNQLYTDYTRVNNIQNDKLFTYSSNLNNYSSNISDNLDKYFTFGVNTNDVNSKIYQRNWDITGTNNLSLIKDTIAVNNLTANKGMRINTSNYNNIYKGLELCNRNGENCYNFYVENDILKVSNPNWNNQTSNIVFSYN
jgi:hypothetical protein